MQAKIVQALNKLFERHRIVFWYDPNGDVHEEYRALSLEEIEKIEIANNEFGIKYRVLRQEPDLKFLLYHNGARPADRDNWLLDVLLAHGEFRTDKVSLWLSELGLGLEFADVVNEHTEFYESVKRCEALKKLLKSDDTPGKLRLKMLAVCTSAEPRLESVLEMLLAEFADEREEKMKLCDRCHLLGFFWQQLEKTYGYNSSTPSLQDFTIELFKSCYAMAVDGEVKLTPDALVFLKRWKDSRRWEKVFEKLSDSTTEILDIEKDLNRRDFRVLLEVDYFRLIDRKILRDLAKAVRDRTVSSADVSAWTRQRRQGHWYGEHEHLYTAVDHAGQFLAFIDQIDLSIESATDGVQKYCQSWFRLDQNYRKFIFHAVESGQSSLLSSLNEQIENFYSNRYLLPLGDRWQRVVDGLERWSIHGTTLQKNFFRHWVEPFLKKDKKVCVIISDALRYEIGDELVSKIRQEDRFEASLDATLSMLPSYTQLGMAALLPNETLAIVGEGGNGTVQVDGHSSQGLENRGKILEMALGEKKKKAIAIGSEDLMKLNGEESRCLFHAHDVVYVYHNRIDMVGDKRDSEERVFEAVEKTFDELVVLIKKLTNANATNLIVTADHGFLYQHGAIEESDFSVSEIEGEEIYFRNRRFVLGRGLQETKGAKKFHAKEVGLDGEIEIQIPKSINRLRQQGSGSRFVHGGATLQEVIVPVIVINKKRRSDLSTVKVDILRGSSTTITSGQLAVNFYQKEPVTEKVQAIKLRAGIYTSSGEAISDSHELIFDSTSENPREREKQVRFILTAKANTMNNQEVFVKLEEKVEGTSHYREYQSIAYTIQRSFTSDFDF